MAMTVAMMVVMTVVMMAAIMGVTAPLFGASVVVKDGLVLHAALLALARPQITGTHSVSKSKVR